MNGWIPIIALAASVIGPLFAYIVATRRLSGKISTSEASELWSVSNSMLDRLTQQDVRARELISGLEARNRDLEAEIYDLRSTVFDLTSKLNSMDRRNPRG